MEKRTLLAIVLSITVLILYQVIFVGKPVPPPSERPPAPKEEPIKVIMPIEPTEGKPTPQLPESTVKVQTELYTAVFTTRGGTLKSLQLRHYKDKDGLSISLLKDIGVYPALGIGSKNDFSISKENFALIGNDLTLSGEKKTGSIVFEYASPKYSIRRTYTFYSDSYRFDLKDELKGIPEYEITLGTDFGVSSKKDATAHIGPVLLTDSDRVELTVKKLKEPKTYKGKLRWIAQEDKYFFASLVPLQGMNEAKAWEHQGSAAISLKGDSELNSYIVYAGAKDHEKLKALGIGLEHIIDFGFFSIIARPLFWLLKFLNKFVGNYGWAIVLLTIIVRIPFIPIVNKGQKAMKKLQEIQPKMAEIREKYKKDPKRMQTELSELYKKYKVNPMGGCLPMLLQIPVFFALYKILSVAIELRGAPFMLWVTDLSLKDPYYIMPIVMGATMVIQQKLTPSGGDPKQQKLMMFLPVIFTFLFLSFASGLVLYWLVNNVLSIVQQVYMNKKAKASGSG
ncbi:MAG: membrane protein insertase YidC [Nitrospirae bacterium]|nr:membrane protein insertase YidC [Nitrospirota bacterium]